MKVSTCAAAAAVPSGLPAVSGAQNRADASARATRLDEVMHGIASVKLNRAETDQTRRFAQIVGRSRDELAGMTMQAITHPDDLPGNLDDAVAARYAVTMQDGVSAIERSD